MKRGCNNCEGTNFFIITFEFIMIGIIIGFSFSEIMNKDNKVTYNISLPEKYGIKPIIELENGQSLNIVQKSFPCPWHNPSTTNYNETCILTKTEVVKE